MEATFPYAGTCCNRSRTFCVCNRLFVLVSTFCKQKSGKLNQLSGGELSVTECQTWSECLGGVVVFVGKLEIDGRIEMGIPLVFVEPFYAHLPSCKQKS
jgi:hypothetical protein